MPVAFCECNSLKKVNKKPCLPGAFIPKRREKLNKLNKENRACYMVTLLKKIKKIKEWRI